MTDDEFTNQNFFLDVGDGHRLHVVDWGNKDAATPFIYLHGGPGSCIKDRYKTFFNPTRHRVIFFDQRGAGESTPTGSLEHNTTDHLVSDINKIINHFKLTKVNLYGFSWGSTLALVYNIRHPEHVKNTIIGGVYSGRNDFKDTMLSYCQTFFPDAYDRVLALTPPDFHADPISYHLEKALYGNQKEQKLSAYVISGIEAAICNNNYDFTLPENPNEFDPASTRIEIHYISNNCFLEDNYILNHAAEIKNPVHIVQGRADFACPPNFAYALSKKLSRATFHWAISNHFMEHENRSLVQTIIDLIA